MPRPDSHQRLMPSLLDRLIDPESEGTAEGQGYGSVQMIEVVRRDLEDLLNTRVTHSDLPEEFVETQNSVLTYGLPDLVSMNAVSQGQREDIGESIALIINRFEPRLRDVHVFLVEDEDASDRTLAFHIDAQLNVDPSPEVGFETVLELMTGHASIKLKEE